MKHVMFSPFFESMHRINESNQWTESMFRINASNQWIESVHRINGSSVFSADDRAFNAAICGEANVHRDIPRDESMVFSKCALLLMLRRARRPLCTDMITNMNANMNPTMKTGTERAARSKASEASLVRRHEYKNEQEHELHSESRRIASRAKRGERDAPSLHRHEYSDARTHTIPTPSVKAICWDHFLGDYQKSSENFRKVQTLAEKRPWATTKRILKTFSNQRTRHFTSLQ